MSSSSNEAARIAVQTNARQAVIDAAIELFAQKGYHETSMREIASLAGIKASSIYNHFPSKMEILKTLIDMYAESSAYNSTREQHIAELYANPNVDNLLNCFYLEFAPEERERNVLLLSIILQEQYRTDFVGDFVKNVLFHGNAQIVVELLNALQEEGIIAPCDVPFISAAHISITMSYASAYILEYKIPVEMYEALKRLYTTCLTFLV